MKNTNKRYSTSYVFTADVNCSNDMQRIGNIKKAISAANQIEKRRHNPRLKRVCLKGRLGKNNPSSVNYRRDGNRFNKTRRPYMSVLIKDAVAFDVYVYSL
jgi:hypothetical protein